MTGIIFQTHSKAVRNAHALLSAVPGEYAPSLVFNTSLPQQIKYHAYVPTDSEAETLIKHDAETDKDMYIASLPAAFGTLRRSESSAKGRLVKLMIMLKNSRRLLLITLKKCNTKCNTKK